MNSTETITCTCKTCKTNGKGKTLGATLPTATIDAMGRSRKTIHGLVFSANDPSFVGASVRKSLNMVAA